MATRTLAGIQWTDDQLSGSEIDLRLHDLVAAAPDLVEVVRLWHLRLELRPVFNIRRMCFEVEFTLWRCDFPSSPAWEQLRGTLDHCRLDTVAGVRRLEAAVRVCLGDDWPGPWVEEELVPEVPRGLTWWERVRAWWQGVGR